MKERNIALIPSVVVLRVVVVTRFLLVVVRLVVVLGVEVVVVVVEVRDPPFPPDPTSDWTSYFFFNSLQALPVVSVRGFDPIEK